MTKEEVAEFNKLKDMVEELDLEVCRATNRSRENAAVISLLRDAVIKLNEPKKISNTSVLKAPISFLSLTVRQFNCLDSVGIRTIGDYMEKDEFELISISGFGRGSLRRIREKLGKLGLIKKKTV